MQRQNEVILQLLNTLLTQNEEPLATSGSKKLFEVGKQYFIRSVPYHSVGRCVDIIDGFVVLENASWVADSGRLYNALTEGIELQDASELEPIPGLLYKNISSIDEFTEYKPKLIVKQK